MKRDESDETALILTTINSMIFGKHLRLIGLNFIN